MSDFPAFNEQLTPTFVHSLSRHMGGLAARSFVFAGPASAVWPASNQAAYIPFSLPWPYVIRRFFWVNGATVTGNCSMGVYTPAGGQIYGGGSTAQAGASAIQYFTPAAPVYLPAGPYLLGLSCSLGTSTIFQSATATAIFGRLLGMYQQATAHPVPSPATFAAWASTGYPLCGFTRTAAGF